MQRALETDALKALIHVSRTVNAHLDLDTVLRSIMSVTTDVMQVEAASLVLVDDATGDLLFHVATGEKAESVKPLRLKAGQGIVGHVVDSGQTLVINDAHADPRFCTKVDTDTGFFTRAILCVPMATNDRLWGAIETLNRVDGEPFSDEDAHLCEAIASQAAIAVENAMLHRRLVNQERLAAIGQTVAGLAHCIKNVLNGIQGGGYMVDLGLNRDNTDTVRRGWGIVRKNNTFLQDLVLDMLSYSKKRRPEYEEADANEIAQTVCGLMEQKAGQLNVLLAFESAPELPRVRVDPKGLRRCLLNLVSNAVDACAGRTPASVNVAVRPVDSGFAFVVSDSGCGIAAEHIERLSQPFFSTKGSKGTGLGLAVTYKIVREHGGRIEVQSEIGAGTEFHMILPLQPPDRAASETDIQAG